MELRSIQHPDAKVSVRYRYGDVEVMVVEVGAGASLMDSTLWGGSSWHLVVDGQAIFQQGDKGWELLPSQSLALNGSQPYRITNPGGDRLRLLSVITGAGATADAETSS